MRSIIDIVRLPTAQCALERAHLATMNQTALWLLWLHVPFVAGVAYVNATGPLVAAALTILTLSGASLAMLLRPTARLTSVVLGVTAMGVAALLVHFGQGPLEDEFHLYFLSLLAVLSVFGNPMVVVTAAVTILLHYVAAYVWVTPVGVHDGAAVWSLSLRAIFVGIEMVGGVVIARVYFDNVIGLESIVADRTEALDSANRSMRLVLENVGEGLVTVDRFGVMGAERSAKAREWLGGDETPAPLVDRIRRVDPDAGEWLELGWQELLDGFMPMSVTLDQLPKRIVRGEQLLKMTYIPIGETTDDHFDQMLVVMSDISADVAREQAEAKQQQLLALIRVVSADRVGFQAFFEDGCRLVDRLKVADSHDPIEVRRWLHTLKGNALSYGMDEFGQTVHALETLLSEEGRAMSSTDGQQLAAGWDAIREGLSMVSVVGERGYLQVPATRAAELERAVVEHREPDEVLDILRSISFQPVALRLRSVAKQAKRIADRLGFDGIHVVVEDNDVAIPPAVWTPFWMSVVHVVRNALAHGIETADERVQAGKPPVGTLTLRAEVIDDWVEISVADDGRGIDWENVRRKSERMGLPSQTHDDLVNALFFDGLSTQDEATTLSGQGMGMSAVRQACVNCGGSVWVRSSATLGTTMTFQFPNPKLGAVAA